MDEDTEDKKEAISFEKLLDKKWKVLFWDDQAFTKQNMLFTEIRMGLERYGWSIHITANKEEAKKLAIEKVFDAVVLDLLENNESVGIDILKYLRKEKPFLPIVMFTIKTELIFIQKAMRGDVSYYLTKPFRSYHDIMRAIEVAVEREKSKEKILHDRYYASVGELAAGVAHFIKNSLWNIEGRCQVLLEKTDKADDSYKLIETIKRRSGDANKVVVALLNFAKGKRKDSEKQTLNIVKNIRNVLELLSFELEHQKISVLENIECDELKIMGNDFNLQEAFLNIIKNAVEAMPDGGTLAVDVKDGKREIEIRITDNGKGMNTETRENLFMPFYTTKVNSFGFGLFETKRILEEHDGTIDIESELKKGTTVTLTFPKYYEVEFIKE